MYNLTKFNPKRELREFEQDLLVYDTSAPFSLNEKDEKMWSYIINTDEEANTLTFHMLWFEGRLCISYHTDNPKEEIRLKASQMARRVKSLLHLSTKAIIVLEAPIITDTNRYEENRIGKSVHEHVTVLRGCLEEANDTSEETLICTLYGEDGKMVSDTLRLHNSSVRVQSTGNNHQVFIKKEVTPEQAEAFCLLLAEFGYAVTEEKIEAYTTETMQQLFATGLFQMEHTR